MVGERLPGEYRDFTIRLEETRREADKVHFDVCAEEVRDPSWISVDMARQLAGEFAQRASKGRGLASAVGDKLLPGAVGNLFQCALADTVTGRSGLRLCIETDSPELAAVAWEVSCVRTGGREIPEEWEYLFLVPGVSVVRRPLVQTGEVFADRPAGAVLLSTALDLSDPHETFGLPVRDANPQGHGSVIRLRDAGRQLAELGLEVIPPRDPISADELRAELDSPTSVFCFGGHGTPDGIVLAGPGPGGRADPTLMPAGELAGLLRESGVGVAVLIACHTATELAAGSSAAREGWASVAATLVRGGVPWVVGIRGLIMENTAAELTREFVHGLAVDGSVDNALARARRGMSTGGWLPVLYTSVQEEQEPETRARRRPPGQEAGPRVLRAFPVVPGSSGDARRLVCDNGPCRLDVLWGLDRGPFRGVLADHPGADLVDELKRLEEETLWWATRRSQDGPALGQATKAHPPLPRRRWYEVSCEGVETPRSLEALRALVTHSHGWTTRLGWDPSGSAMGFVVRCAVPVHAPAGEQRNETAVDHPRRAAELAGAIGALLPGAALILQVTARGEDAEPSRGEQRLLRTAEAAGRLLPPRNDGSGIEPAVMTRVRWGDAAWQNATEPEQGEGGAAQDPPGSEASALLRRYVREENRRSAVEELWEDAGRLLRQIAAEGPGFLNDPYFLAQLFRSDTRADVRARISLLARWRDDATRYASLAAATTREEHLAVWLEAAEGLPAPAGEPTARPAPAGGPVADTCPVDPGRLPPALFPPPVVTCVALGLLRRGDDPARAVPSPDWDELVLPDLRRVFEYLRFAPEAPDTYARREADREFLLGLGTYTASVTAVRSGIGRSVPVGELAPGGRLSPAGWAALTSRPLDTESVRLLSEEPADWMRRLVGFHHARAEPDGTMLRSVEGLRRELLNPRPPLIPAL
ncbi:CHAT domain-containing protein [Streptomyces sp. NPDC093065]|uniref:CHAT domain-containing protein n=1 Tax=Streptomyces sp. NPDC093065 TaxID=3366021 RepID=UPI00382AAB97